ncbi:MAG: agmatinase [Acidobacteriota bacterium]|nr:agmatinase [Acidobacteriota bacterium]
MSTFQPESAQKGRVVLLGLPHDDGSSFLRGCAQAPPLIREALHSDHGNMFTESGMDLGNHPRFGDAGDLDLNANMVDRITDGVRQLLDRGAHVLGLGGDHAVTYPVLRAYAAVYGPVDILHFDAHPDLYDELGGNRLSHACPFARIMEEGLAKRLVQVGIRTMNAHQREQAVRFGVEVIEMRHWQPDLLLHFDGPLYLSLDLDGMDPAFVPGVSHYEPGGLSPRDILGLIQRIDVPLVGADIVEYNPTRDINGMTAVVAAKFVRELTARMIETNPVYAERL